MFQFHLTLLDGVVLAITGIAAGYTGGLLGLGGGVIMVPVLFELLPHIIGPHPQIAQIAVATSLGCVCFTSVSSAHAHNRKGNVDWKLALAAAPTSALGSFAVTTFALKVSGASLKTAFGVFLALMALRLWYFDPRNTAEVTSDPGAGKNGVISASLGLVIGSVGAMFGIGGGSLAVPAFVLAMHRPIHLAVGSASILGITSGLVGTMGYALAEPSEPVPGGVGIVIPFVIVLLSATSIFMAQVGARHATTTDPVRLRRIFAFALFSIGTLVVYRAVA